MLENSAPTIQPKLDHNTSPCTLSINPPTRQTEVHFISFEPSGRFISDHKTTYRKYRIYPAIRQGFCPSRMTSNNYISPMKFCNNTNFTLPKQSQRSRSILQDGSRSLGLFWKEKTLSYNRRNTVNLMMLIMYIAHPI